MEHQLLGNRRLANSPALHSTNNLWKNVVAEISFPCGDRTISIETNATAPVIAADGKWLEVRGKCPKGQFSVYLLSDFCLAIMQSFCPNLHVEALDAQKAAIVLEHSLTTQIATLENFLGTELSIEQLADVETAPSGVLFGMDVFDGENTWPVALSVSGELAEMFENAIKPYSNEAERNLDPRMYVHLGPVVLPARQAFLVSPKSSIDCGVQPNDVIKGFLLRSDNYYWPVYIEDEMVEICGELAGPIDPATIPSNQVFATFGIGEVSLTAAQRSMLGIGVQVSINRYPQSAVDIYFQAIPYGSGNLMLLGNNLGISVAKLGDAENRKAFDDFMTTYKRAG